MAFGACTPEAVEVDPASAGAAGEEPNGDGASGATEPTAGVSGSEAGGSAGMLNTGGSMPTGGQGGGGGSNNCAPLSSPKQACTACIPQQCMAEAMACSGTACSCGNYGGYQGQMNCLLACSSLSPMMDAANACASQCGFGSLGASDKATHQLFDCLVNPPAGPPLCPECFPVH